MYVINILKIYNIQENYYLIFFLKIYCVIRFILMQIIKKELIYLNCYPIKLLFIYYLLFIMYTYIYIYIYIIHIKKLLYNYYIKTLLNYQLYLFLNECFYMMHVKII